MRLAAPHYDDGVDRTNSLSLRILEDGEYPLNLEAAFSSPQMQQNITQLQQLAAKWFNQHLTRSGRTTKDLHS
jgi:predicted AAA+ superfamily ATPase